MACVAGLTLSADDNKENIDPDALIDVDTVDVDGQAGSAGSPAPIPTPEAIVLPSPSSQPSSSQESIPESPASSVCYTSSQSLPRRDSEEDTESEDGDVTSRKQKSLGLLCQRFLLTMKAETEASFNNDVHLESVARKMNVEKRRIYDIVNVMEALEAMSKTNKSYYRWHGLGRLPQLMSQLQDEAVAEHLPARILRVEQAMCSFTELSGSRDSVGSLVTSPAAPAPLLTSPLHRHDSGYASQERQDLRPSPRDRNGKNSLVQLCRRFLMVLLSNPQNKRRVSLDVASTVLIKDPETEGFEPPSRSRCRRLYDIANVLVAMGLIKKVHYLFGTKKIPLFVYSGPEPDATATLDEASWQQLMAAAALASPVSSAPVTPRGVKRTSIGGGNHDKMPRVNPSDPFALMMNLAEVAERERLRCEAERTRSVPSSPMGAPLVRTASGQCIARPTAQRQPAKFPSFGLSPLSSPLMGRKGMLVRVGDSFQFSPVPQGFSPIVLPKPAISAPVPASRPDLNELFRASLQQHMGVVRTAPVYAKTPAQPQPVKPLVSAPKHSVSSILGVSQKSNIDHKQSSPFQPVKRPFGMSSNVNTAMNK